MYGPPYLLLPLRPGSNSLYTLMYLLLVLLTTPLDDIHAFYACQMYSMSHECLLSIGTQAINLVRQCTYTLYTINQILHYTSNP